MSLIGVSYAAIVLFIRFLERVLCRKVEIVGKEHVPRRGPLIVASNHLNNADPPIIAAALPRRAVFMAKKEMFDWPVLSWLFKAFGAFPVRRGEVDLRAMRRAIQELEKGRALMMFPEGTRSRDARLHRGRPGTAILAMKTGAPILPVAIYGTEHIKWPWLFFKPLAIAHVRVTFGEPFFLPKVDRITTKVAEEYTDLIMRRIAALLPEEYRGEYAGGVAAGAGTEREAIPQV
jgi:1-acyl-sn-glycerol-3-phosphate acyltransferase